MRKPEWSLKQQLFMVFLVFFVVGIVVVNVTATEMIQNQNALFQYFLKQFQYAKVDAYDLLWCVTWQRVQILCLLLLFGMCVFYKWFYGLFVAWSGFAWGYFCVLALGCFGAKGFLLCIVALFPQYLFYVPTFLLLVEIYMHRGMYKGKKRIGMYAVIFSSLLIGILLEAYVNPVFLQKILKIF